MKRSVIAAFAAAATVAAPLATAAAGDRWYGTNEGVFNERRASVEITTATVDGPVYREERVFGEVPVIVSRDHDYIGIEPREVLVLREYEPAYYDRGYAWNPETGQRIGAGLFNRAGPNDFGQ
jgi:hypothetical protein